MYKALILDLDNTIFKSKTISDDVFAEIKTLMHEYRGNISNEQLDEIWDQLSRTPFQKIADNYPFKEGFKEKGIEILKETVYNGTATPYKDYELIQSIPLEKYLVTFGFVKLQNSKVDALGIRGDFKEVHIVDPELRPITKKDIFQQIMDEHGYSKEDLLVIGDDPESEIKAAKELKIKTYLYDPESRFKTGTADYHEQNYKLLLKLVEKK
ncbi:HAD family hydrolase [Mucilaginibacter sp. KACC 22063]|uniref:HAD family hydrolase n=1 Tax=Mucilaginibacter sp. KACC 22063 TaxID=3025666 RepID=UPI0023671F1F|nr:HAD family hydrolase [Mucilaginibacter sp. KACC 22063]WDF54313.1 HAD family hydrolase [Mucilaginibacter sp. KACC 22063]